MSSSIILLQRNCDFVGSLIPAHSSKSIASRDDSKIIHSTERDQIRNLSSAPFAFSQLPSLSSIPIPIQSMTSLRSLHPSHQARKPINPPRRASSRCPSQNQAKQSRYIYANLSPLRTYLTHTSSISHARRTKLSRPVASRSEGLRC